jgi:hypothetical protein
MTNRRFPTLALVPLLAGFSGCSGNGPEDMSSSPAAMREPGSKTTPDVDFKTVVYAGSSWSNPGSGAPSVEEGCLNGWKIDLSRIVLVGARAQLEWAYRFGEPQFGICWKPSDARSREAMDFVRRDGTILHVMFDARPRYHRQSQSLSTFHNPLSELDLTVEELPPGSPFEGKSRMAHFCGMDPSACQAMGKSKP